MALEATERLRRLPRLRRLLERKSIDPEAYERRSVELLDDDEAGAH